jgi:hypothetical protein
MVKQKDDMKDVRDQLYKLRLQGRESYLELMGVDIKKVRQLEKKIDGQYDELFGKVREMVKNSGKENVELHKKSLERFRLMNQLNTEKTITSGMQQPDSYVYIPKMCLSIFTAPLSELEGHGYSIETEGGGSGLVTFDPGNIAHPIADSNWGQGTGTISNAQVNTWFKFKFRPATTRRYCIRPIVHMSGHWLIWTWGTCATPEDQGSGEVWVKLRVRVKQEDFELAAKEHLILEETAAGGNDIESGFAYDSQVDGGASLNVELFGDCDAIVYVECESYARISNHGRAYVDMKTSPSFYFSVPEVWWGIPIPYFLAD